MKPGHSDTIVKGLNAADQQFQNVINEKETEEREEEEENKNFLITKQETATDQQAETNKPDDSE